MPNRRTLSLEQRRALDRLDVEIVGRPDPVRQQGGYERAKRHAVRLARFPGFLLGLVNGVGPEPPLAGLSPQETVTLLAKYVPEVGTVLRRWRVPHVRSPSPLILVPFVKACFDMAPVLARLARPPHRMTIGIAQLRVIAQHELQHRWASIRFAMHFFTRTEEVAGWHENCLTAAAWFEQLRSVPDSTYALLRRCRTPQCPTSLFLYRGGRPPRICPRCRQSISRSSRRRTVTD